MAATARFDSEGEDQIMKLLWTLAPTRAEIIRGRYPFKEWELHDGKKVVGVYKTDLATAQVQVRLKYPTKLFRVSYVPRKKRR